MVGVQCKEMVMIGFLCVLLPILAEAAGTSGGVGAAAVCTGVFSNSYKSSFGVVVAWTVDCTKETISMKVEAPTQGWVGIGWNTQGSMPNADICFAWVDDGSKTQYIYDAKNGNYVAPTEDAQNDLTGATVTQNATYTVVSFTKKLDTGDTNGDIPLTPTEELYLIIAVKATDPTGNKISGAAKHDNAVAPAVNFFSGSTATTGSGSTSGSTTGGVPSDLVDKCSGGVTYTGNYNTAGGEWGIVWTIDCTALTFSAVLTATGTGWVGFGLGQGLSMVPADVIQASCTTAQTVSFQDGKTVDYVPPVADTTNDYTDVTCTEGSGKTTISFTRPLVTSNSTDLAFSVDSMNMLWALHATSDDITEQHTAKGVLQINFFTGAIIPSNTVDLYLVHGIIMILAWALLSPIATYIASYLKKIGHLWFQLHVTLQVLTFVFLFIGFVTVESALGPTPSSHFKNFHNVVGLIIFLLSFGQVGLGYVADKLYDPQRTKVPTFPDQIHRWLGRTLFALTLLNIYLGFGVYGYSTTNRGGTFAVFSVWWVVMVAAVLLTEYVNTKKLNYYESGKEAGKIAEHKRQLAILGGYTALAIIFFAVIASLMFKQ